MLEKYGIQSQGWGVLGVDCLGHLSESNGYEGYWILTSLKGRHFLGLNAVVTVSAYA